MEALLPDDPNKVDDAALHVVGRDHQDKNVGYIAKDEPLYSWKTSDWKAKAIKDEMQTRPEDWDYSPSNEVL